MKLTETPITQSLMRIAIVWQLNSRQMMEEKSFFSTDGKENYGKSQSLKVALTGCLKGQRVPKMECSGGC